MAATIAAGKNIPMSSPVRRKILMGDMPVVGNPLIVKL